MRIALGVSRTAVLLLAGIVAGCVTVSPSGGNTTGDLPGLALLPGPEQRQVLDSLQAEQIAEADAPRVRVTANFEDDMGSRRVEAFIRADDDAYVLVGHIDANGRLQIVYPKHPGDDEFVRGGHSYRIPPFFGGFADEYRYRRSTDYTRLSMVRSREDSYDAGTGYVFVIASWRPMRTERVADGDRWSSYELSSDEYLTDPRAAVDELAQVVAGDSREAYTVEYAHYRSSNYGMYSANSYDRCSFAGYGTSGYGFGGLGLAYSPFYGGFGYGLSPWSFGAFGYPAAGFFSPFSYARQFDPMTGCSYYVPVYRPVFVTTYPIVRNPAPGMRAFKPELPRPPKLGDVPGLAGPAAPSGNATRPGFADLKATDLNGMHPASPAAHPSIEQMVRRHRTPDAVSAGPGGAQFPIGQPMQRERPRFAPPAQAEPPRYTPPAESRPRGEQQPRTAPAPTPHHEAPPMRVQPMHQSPPPASSGSSGGSSSSGSSSGGHGGKPKP